jgi:hypothetical protein
MTKWFNRVSLTDILQRKYEVNLTALVKGTRIINSNISDQQNTKL